MEPGTERSALFAEVRAALPGLHERGLGQILRIGWRAREIEEILVDALSISADVVMRVQLVAHFESAERCCLHIGRGHWRSPIVQSTKLIATDVQGFAPISPRH